MAAAITWTVGVLLALGGGFVLAMRATWRPFQRPLTLLQRSVLNPMQLRGSAGEAGAYASVVHHVGRRSGTAYRTPVVIADAPDGRLVVALPYGSRADWAQNVLAAGRATVEHEGRRLEVAASALVDRATANPWFPTSEQRAHRFFDIDEFLVLAPVDVDRTTDGPKGTVAGDERVTPPT